MPFFADVYNPDLRGNTMLETPRGRTPEKPDPFTTGDLFGAAARKDNEIVNLYNDANRLPNAYDPPDPDYKPFEDPLYAGSNLVNDPIFRDRLTGSFNHATTERMFNKRMREIADDDMLDRGGVPGVIFRMVAGGLSPTMLMPGGAFYRAGKIGYRAGRTAVSTGLAGAAAIGTQEAILQASQIGRTKEESAINIAAGTLLMGIIGAGAAGLLSRGERQILSKAIAQEQMLRDTPHVGASGAGAAEIAEHMTGKLAKIVPTWVSKPYEAVKGALDKVPYAGPAVKAVLTLPEKLALRTNPYMRLMQSEVKDVRLATLDLINTPLRTEDNWRGMTSSPYGASLEQVVKVAMYRAEFTMETESRRLFQDFRGAGILRAKMEKVFGSSQPDFVDFMEHVADAMRNKDVHEISQVSEMSKVFRSYLNDAKNIVKEVTGVDYGDSVLGADSFFPRIYSRAKLREDRGGYVNDMVEHLSADQETKSVIQNTMERVHTQFRNSLDMSGKIERRIDTAEKRLAAIDAKLQERGMGAKASGSRLDLVSERNVAAKETLDEWKNFRAELAKSGDTPTVRKDIARIDKAIKEMEKNSQPITEADLDALDAAETKGELVGGMKRVANYVTGRTKGGLPKPPSFWRWLAKHGGIKDLGGDIMSRRRFANRNYSKKEISGLIKEDGLEWDDVQKMLADKFPELAARWNQFGDELAGDFTDEIRDMVRSSLDGEQPDWWLDSEWNVNDRFVAHEGAYWDEMLQRADIKVKTDREFVAFIQGNHKALSQDKFDAMFDSLGAIEDANQSGVVHGAMAEGEAESLRNLRPIRAETIAIFRSSLENAHNNFLKAKGKVVGTGAASKEATIAAARDANRMGELARQQHVNAIKMDALEGVRARLEAEQELAQLDFEKGVNDWHGNTTKAAQSALARRAAKEAGTGPQPSQNTPLNAQQLARNEKVFREEGKTVSSGPAQRKTAGPRGADSPRLKEADAEVLKAVKGILESNQRKSVEEMKAMANQSAEQIVNDEGGLLPKDEPGTNFGDMSRDEFGKMRGSMNTRKNPMPDMILKKWLNNNPMDVIPRYLRQVYTDMEMIRRFGDVEGKTSALPKMREGYNKLIEKAAGNQKEINRLEAAKTRAENDWVIARDRLRGVFGLANDEWGRKAGRIANMFRDTATMTLAGGFGPAQIPDLGGAIWRHGMTNAFRFGYIPYVRNLVGFGDKLSKQQRLELKRNGIGFEHVSQMNTIQRRELFNPHQELGKAEQLLRGAATGVVTLSGTQLMTDGSKTIAGMTAGSIFLRMAERIANKAAVDAGGTALTKAGIATNIDIATMAHGGITPHDAVRIWKAFAADTNGSYRADNGYVPSTDTWADRRAADLYLSAINHDVEIGVVTPGQETPAWLNQPTISLLGLFKRFVASANTRILLAGLQKSANGEGAHFLSGAVASVGLGMLTHTVWATASGYPLPTTTADWIKQGQDRSGMLAWYNEFNAMAAKFSGGTVDAWALAGAKSPYGRYASRNFASNLAGPAFGIVTDIGGMGYPIATGNVTARDIHTIRRLMPFQNLFYLRMLIDQVEHGAANALGVPASRTAN